MLGEVLAKNMKKGETFEDIQVRLLAELNSKDLEEEIKFILEESKTFHAPQKVTLRELVDKF